MLITNARILNEGSITEGDVLIKRGRIEKIAAGSGGTGDVLQLQHTGSGTRLEPLLHDLPQPVLAASARRIAASSVS